jgi:hypothetical protein
MLHQISVFAENKPGKIDRITEILEKEDVNIRAITISDTGDYGIIKLVVDKPQEGCDALKEAGIAAALKEIVAVKIDDSPGGLGRVASSLSRNNINVTDATGFTLRESNEAVFVFQAENASHAEKVLKDEGFVLLKDNELYCL